MIIKMGNKINLRSLPSGGGPASLKPLTSFKYINKMLEQLHTIKEYNGDANMILIHKKISPQDWIPPTSRRMRDEMKFLFESNKFFSVTTTFDEDTSDPGNDDIDLSVYSLNAPDCANATELVAQLGASAGATSEEVIDLSNAPAGAYYIFVDYYSSSNGTDTLYNLWVQLVLGDAGNTTVTAPAGAVQGASDTVTVDYAGLVPTRHLGVLHHSDADGEIGRTIIDVDAR